MSTPTDANDINSLRAELFGALRDLRAKKIDPDHARAVSDLAQTIINTAKAELAAMQIMGFKNAPRFLALTGQGTAPASLDAVTKGKGTTSAGLKTEVLGPGHRRYRMADDDAQA